MRASGPHFHSGKAGVGIALGLVLLILIIGCDSTPAIVSTPTSVAPNLVATPTQLPPTATVERASPITTSALSTSTPASAWSPSIQWRGGEWYLLGVNYPYYHYGNDFGGNVWGSYGVHDPTTNAEVDADFERMSAMGIRTVRWFVFADGRAGITYDAAGCRPVSMSL